MPQPYAIIVLALLSIGTLASSAHAQLEDGDALIASNVGLTLIRNGVANPVAPSATDGNAIVPAAFGNGAIAIVLAEDLAIYAEGAGSFGVYLLDFSASVGAPASTLLGTANAGVPGLTHDPVTGAVFGVTTSGEIFRIPGPIGPTSTIDPTPYATGQAGAIALAGGGPLGLLTGDQSQVWSVAAGDSAPTAPVVSLTTGGLSDLAYDPGDDRLFVSTFGSSRVDAYQLGTGEFLGTIIASPALTVADAVDYDPRDDQVYALSRLAPTLSGVTWGNQVSFDNVLVCADADGLSAPLGCSPQTGHGNSGLNAALAIARGPVIRIDFDPATVSTVFDATNGTLSAGGTVSAVSGSIPVTDPMIDGLVGALVTLDATYFGNDLVGLSDVGLAALDLRVLQATVSPGPPDVQVTTPLSNNEGGISAFGGATGATALVSRRFSLVQPMTATSLGASSRLTALFANAIAGGSLTVDFDARTGAFRGVGLNLNARAAAFDTRLGTTGQGELELGTIGAPGFARLFHLATPILTTPTGSGPFLGLAADFGILDQLSRPLGAEPFSVLADANGTYRFNLPLGSVPAGTAFDYVGLAWDVGAGTVVMSRPRTITF